MFTAVLVFGDRFLVLGSDFCKIVQKGTGVSGH